MRAGRTSNNSDKFKIEQLARSSTAFVTVTAVNAGAYFENFTVPFLAELMGGLPFKTDSDGYLTISLPRHGGNDLCPFTAIEDDYGDFVHGVLLDPEKWGGKVIQAISDQLTYAQICEICENST